MMTHEARDRRAFLRGLMLTSAGLLVPRPFYSIPAVIQADPAEVYRKALMDFSSELGKGFGGAMNRAVEARLNERLMNEAHEAQMRELEHYGYLNVHRKGDDIVATWPGKLDYMSITVDIGSGC